jgi:hypothetical protein
MNTYYYDKKLNRLEIFLSEKKSIICLFCDALTKNEIEKTISEMLIKYKAA